MRPRQASRAASFGHYVPENGVENAGIETQLGLNPA
jgi:3-oxoacyl-[acyl-carrier-protein] synthase III